MVCASCTDPRRQWFVQAGPAVLAVLADAQRNLAVRRAETQLTFALDSSSSFHSSLLAEENFDVTDWEVVAVSGEVVATKRIPIEIPHFRLHREVPQTVAALRERLDAIQLEDFESVEACLWEVWSCWSIELCNFSHAQVDACRQWFIDKLIEISDEDVESYISVSTRLTGHYWDSAGELAIEALAELVGPEHKELILCKQRCGFQSLWYRSRSNGWQEEALPSMLAQCQNRIPPWSWGLFFFEKRPDDFELLVPFAAHSYGFYRKRKLPKAVAATLQLSSAERCLSCAGRRANIGT